MSTSDPSALAPKSPRKYVRAVGPRLRKLLYLVFFLVALLGANSSYLATITFLEWVTDQVLQNVFYLYMFLLHLVLGGLLIVPLIVFGVIHMRNSWNRRNRRAVRVGYALFFAAIVVLVTGLMLVRVGNFDLKHPTARAITYWSHIAAPLISGWLYWLHRLAGPRIRWKIGFSYAGVVGLVILLMIGLHSQDPKKWNVRGPKEGAEYFFPSLAATTEGKFLNPETLLSNDMCQRCHSDVYDGWAHSVHHRSSFNNPPYLASVRETRKYSLEKFGTVKASRFCAGCHDPVPFLTGAFDDPDFDDQTHPTAHAGITCTVCHAITHVPESGPRGNADYTIEEPSMYPFAKSDNSALQWVHDQLIKAKPSFHKKVFLKPLHKSAEFCASCHKVHLPQELNDYKFLRGQNHFDSYHLSGVAHGARSFYYPEKAQQNCNDCHMPFQLSDDFGARAFSDSKKLGIHDHLFASHNTGIAHLYNDHDTVRRQQESLKGVLRVDIFGLRDGDTVAAPLMAPLRPDLPTLQPSKTYLLETVIRTLKVGHHFTQGTVDSNEVWLDVTVRSGDRIIGRSGALDDDRRVDPWSHFVNAFVLDRDGNRISRRNAQDIFVALYNHQMPPGAGQTVHFKLAVPDDLTEHLTVDVKLLYRKFDVDYMDFVTKSWKKGDPPIAGFTPGQPYKNDLPITVLASDQIILPVEGVEGDVVAKESSIPEWQRWNDYGIGLFLKGENELRQAADAFKEVERLGRFDGPLNLARVYERDGQRNEAARALQRAGGVKNPEAPPWTLNWLSGVISRKLGNLKEAEKSFRAVLSYDAKSAVGRERGFDFSQDYLVINLLGRTLSERAQQLIARGRESEGEQYQRAAVEQFERVLELDSENVTAHFNLIALYQGLGDEDRAEEHRQLHQKYKIDDTARGRAVRLAKEKYPAADHAAEEPVIYNLQRPDAPGLTGMDEATISSR